MENDRHFRFLKSVLNLDYSNYRFIYVDDLSDDGTLAKTS